MRKGALYILLFVLVCLCGCAGQEVEDPAALRQNRDAIDAFTVARAKFWTGGTTRLTASIQPESRALLSALSVNFAFQSIYRTYPDGSTKFVMFMPQGTRLGSCERSASGVLMCQQLPLPGAEDVVIHSFAALDNLMAAAPRADDQWRLQYGERLGGVSANQQVTIRERTLGHGAILRALYSARGTPAVLYKAITNSVQWKMVFRAPEAAESVAVYQYMDQASNWNFTVNILEAN